MLRLALLLTAVFAASPGLAQTPPSAAEIAAYSGLHAAVARGDRAEVARLLAARFPTEARDGHGRTPLHVAAHLRRYREAEDLLRGGADPNALDSRRYDIVTIAAVANDLDMLAAAFRGGASAKNVTSPYDGTALIAAAHLGHAEVVKALIAQGAPLDHVNNLGWTALMESVVLGDGGANHTATLTALVKAGANVNIPDREGRTPLAHARARGYAAMVDILTSAGAR